MVDILSAVLTDGIDAVDGARAEALSHKVQSTVVVLNFLARRHAGRVLAERHEPPPPLSITTPDALQLA